MPTSLLPDSQFLIYRDDTNHKTVSGNKLHKLRPNLNYAKQHGHQTILSFGGPYSNHLHALAYACQKVGLASIGIVRGELHTELTPTLKDCQQWGMKLLGLPRKPYRDYLDLLGHSTLEMRQFETDFPAITEKINIPENTLILPEGGSNIDAIDALTHAYEPLFQTPEYSDITHAVCATGTGATVAGLRQAAPDEVMVIGVQAVAEGDATLKRIEHWLNHRPKNLLIIPGHLGRFAKLTNELKDFITTFEQQRAIPLDPVYNAKVLFKLSQMHANDFFSSTDKVLIIHTGGLQGNRGYQDLNTD